MVFEIDKEFLRYVKRNKEMGYGRMMQIISNQWYKEAEEKQEGMGGGAFVANECVGFLTKKQRKEYLGIIQQEEEEGMEYGK